MPTYNHAFTLSFEVQGSADEDGSAHRLILLKSKPGETQP